MKPIRIVLVGFGVVGRGFTELLGRKRDYLRLAYDLDLQLVGIGSRSRGFIYQQDGLDPSGLLDLVARGRPLTDCDGVLFWKDFLPALSGIDADLVVEVTPTNLRDGEPGLGHIRA